MKNYSEKVPWKEYWKNEKARMKRWSGWGLASGNFGRYCEDTGWKA